MRHAAALAKLRATCLALPGVIERPSHGMPAWFVGEGRKQKQFAVFSNDHHGDNRVALVCAAPDGMQAMLVDSNADVYYVPPYVGSAGWVGVRLDKDLPWSQVEAILESAHATRYQPPSARGARSRPRSASAPAAPASRSRTRSRARPRS